MAKYISLYSGSSGNCSRVEEGGKFILIDVGKSARITLRAINDAGLDVRNLQGVFISHEHSDHISGLEGFLKNRPVPVYTGAATLDYLTENGFIPPACPVGDLNFETVEAGPFLVRGFDTPHDSLGCLGFKILTDGGSSMSLATDLGSVPDPVYRNLKGCRLAVIESNYDPAMLKDGPYPYYLKRRIASDRGHLSNLQASRAIIGLVEDGREKIQLCHLSNTNNLPRLALEQVRLTAKTLGFDIPDYVEIAANRRHEITPFVEF